MAEELSDADIKTLEALIANMQESGEASIRAQELALWPVVWFVVREGLKWAARTAICVTQPDRFPEGGPVLERLANVKQEITLGELMTLRDRLLRAQRSEPE
jgi:hypothetical protein